MDQVLKAKSVILVSIPKLKLAIARVIVKAVTPVPGKTIAVELPEPISHHNCDGFCADRRGWWVTPENIIPAKDEAEARRMLAEAQQLAEAQKPRQMQMVIKDGTYKLAELAKD